MWNCNNDDKNKIAKLEYDNAQLNRRLEKLQNDKENDKKLDMSNSIFEFDFAALDAFSIERIADGGAPHTVIGYIRGHDECGTVIIGQWTFYCSHAEHNRLAEKFRVYYEARPYNNFLKKDKKK